MSSSSLSSATALVFVCACWVTDLRTRTIPNALTAGAAVGGLFFHVMADGWAGLASSATGGALMLLVLLGPFALGGIGGGDVKMMAALGTLVGPAVAAASLVAGMVMGGVVTLAHLLRVRRVGEKVRGTGRSVILALRGRSLAPLRASADSPEAIALPYSLPLGLGVVSVVLFHWGGSSWLR